MGTQLTYLNKPVLEKEMDEGENSQYEYVACSMQGWRTNMEDAHLAKLDFHSDHHIFGVFDGHGGKEVAIWVEEHFIDILKSQKKFKEGSYNDALYRSFIEVDKQLDTKDAKKEMMKIREHNPEGKNPFLELLGLSDIMEKGNTDSLDMFDNIGCTANVLMIADGKYY